MTHIEMRCECGGIVVFGCDEKSASGLGVLGRCKCGTDYKLAGGRILSAPAAK